MRTIVFALLVFVAFSNIASAQNNQEEDLSEYRHGTVLNKDSRERHLLVVDRWWCHTGDWFGVYEGDSREPCSLKLRFVPDSVYRADHEDYHGRLTGRDFHGNHLVTDRYWCHDTNPSATVEPCTPKIRFVPDWIYFGHPRPR